MTKPTIGIGLIGSGFMGRCHAHAFNAVSGLFDLPVNLSCEVLADASEEIASAGAEKLGFFRSTSDWRSMIEDPKVDIVAITAPNVLHEPMAMAAIAAGKTVYCEKPLSTTADSALKMTEAAEDADVVTLVGFNFLRNPMVKLARDIITSGEIGAVTGFRGRHAENYMCNPDTPHSFRTDTQGGGALADIGSHIVSMARYLLGPVTATSGVSQTIHTSRPKSLQNLERAPVLVDDMTHALLRFECGIVGSIEANWAATGRTMDLSFEVTGTKGAVAFSQERMNELQLITGTGPLSGFTRIEAGPQHPPYAQFCPAAGHHLGFNDLKVIEVAQLINAHLRVHSCDTDFREAYEVQKTIEAIQRSAAEACWTAV